MSEAKGFNEAYQSLPPKLRRRVKKNLMKRVFMVEQSNSFYAKKNGTTAITKYEWAGVEREFAKYGVNAETGEVCQTQK